MRTAVFLVSSLLAGSVALASSFNEVSKAVNDDQMLIFAGLEPAQALVRKQCGAVVVETDDPPEFFDCVYVQTDKDLNLFSLEDGHLMSELQLKLATLDGVALQHMGRYSQVQLFDGNRVAALYIHGKGWIDTAQTRAVYQWLRERGVPEKPPHRWIGP